MVPSFVASVGILNTLNSSLKFSSPAFQGLHYTAYCSCELWGRLAQRCHYVAHACIGQLGDALKEHLHVHSVVCRSIVTIAGETVGVFDCVHMLQACMTCALTLGPRPMSNSDLVTSPISCPDRVLGRPFLPHACPVKPLRDGTVLSTPSTTVFHPRRGFANPPDCSVALEGYGGIGAHFLPSKLQQNHPLESIDIATLMSSGVWTKPSD